MKIHHVVPHFYPEKGGVETNVLGLSRYLMERGHEVVVHTARRSIQGRVLPAEETYRGIHVRRYPSLVRFGYYATLLRPKIDVADVVHLHGYGFLTNDRVARMLDRSTPIVYSLHHGVAQRPPTAAGRIKRALYDPLLGKKTLQRVAAIVPASEPDRAWLEARGFPRDRIHVLPSGLDPAAFHAGSPDRARERFRLGEYVVFLGRLHREKSPDHVLRAVASLRGAWDGSVVFVGPDGGERTRLARLADELGLRGRIVFAGETDDATKRDILSGAACLVLPSFYEAQGIAILEAWAQGRAVVASRVGGVPYLVHDRHDGLLYDWHDIPALTEHLRRILGNPEMASALGRAGLEKARTEYLWDRIAPRFEQIYEGVLHR